jgi:hypothetical protein
MNFLSCALCPRLCRHVCPVAWGTGREAATPTMLATMQVLAARGEVSSEVAYASASLCTDCGACSEHCHNDNPLSDWLREARVRDQSLADLPEVVGEGDVLLITSDNRAVAGAVAKSLQRSVATLSLPNGVGLEGLSKHERTTRLAEVSARCQARDVVVTDGEVASALTQAKVPWRWLHELLAVDSEILATCHEGQASHLCCGAREPIRSAHPAAAQAMAKRFAEEMTGGLCADVRCANHLRACGVDVTDIVDVVVAGERDGK